MKTLILASALLLQALVLSAQTWNVNGNAGNTNYFIGTTNNYDLLFRTNLVERLRIKASGNVGIGVANPTQRLDVNGNLRVRGDIYVDNTLFQGGNFQSDSVDAGLLNAGDISAQKINTDSLRVMTIKMDSSSKIIGKANFEDDVSLKNNQLRFGNNEEYRLGLKNFTGNNIFTFNKWDGDHTPVYNCYFNPFNIHPNEDSRLFLFLENYNPGQSDSANQGIAMGVDGSNAIIETGGHDVNSQDSKLLINTNCGHDVVIGKLINHAGNLFLNGKGIVGNAFFGTEALFTITGINTLDANNEIPLWVRKADGGNLLKIRGDAHMSFGYGEIESEYNYSFSGSTHFKGSVHIANGANTRLAVDGNIYAREMKVTQGVIWPDYVFKKNYKLPSLKETEDFIIKNGHLPETPTSKEVENNGLNIADMLTLQMKKIEEMTLYIIDQQKQMEILKNEFNQIKK
ncbi:MAG: hypothetical protein ACK5JC_04950 [Bacteroidota bacterium]